MVCFNRFAWWSLACFFGLIFFSNNAFATNYSSKNAALQACLTNAASTLQNTKDATRADCVFDAGYKVQNGKTLQGGYICKVEVRSASNFKNNTATVGFCPSSFANIDFPLGFYDTFTFTSRYPTVDPFTTNFYYYWEEVDQCLTTSDINNFSMRAPTSNGSGDVCYQGCAYNISVGYEGTWPVGKIFYDATSLKRACNSNDKPPTNQPLPPDSPPLDLPGQTPEPGPPPGNGNSNNNGSSGGGDCTSPPVCQGDSIQCNLLFQTWSIRCENKGNNGNNGGDGGDGGDVNVDLSGVESRLDQLHQDNADVFKNENNVINTDGIKQKLEFSTDKLDMSGMGFNRSCHFDPISIPVGDTTFSADFNLACGIFNWTGYLVVALASFLGCFILIRV